jgi:hypothetical protein
MSAAIFAVFCSVVGLAPDSASAQNYTAPMDPNEWNRLLVHFQRLQEQINYGVQSETISPAQAWSLQKELGDIEVNALWQRFQPNGDNRYPIWQHLHHVHVVLGGGRDRDREFDRY